MASSTKNLNPSSVSGGTEKLSPWNPFEKSKLASASGTTTSGDNSKKSYYASTAPAINTPVGGGALKSIEEKFQVNAATGTCSLSVPFPISSGRNDLTPSISLSYDSGSGNGPFGLGWSLDLPSISRKTAKGIPQYDDTNESDVFLLTGVEDLVPKVTSGNELKHRSQGEWEIREYWPRIEGSFSRIERWSKPGEPAETYWRTISGTNVTSMYGRTHASRIMGQGTGRIFAWLICDSFDDRGNAIHYDYTIENSASVQTGQAHERSRTNESRATNRYIKSIKYGNVKPARDDDWKPRPVPSDGWLFEVVFDYGDHSKDAPTATADKAWPARQDPFSTYVAGFEVRTYRLCRRILLFHHMEKQLGTKDYLVKSMDLIYSEAATVSVLTQVTQTGYATDQSHNRHSRSLPSLDFEYSKVDLSLAETRSVPAQALPNLPGGLFSPVQWTDLDGTGKCSPLVVSEGTWFQIKNLSKYEADYHDPLAGKSEVRFGPLERLGTAPSTAADGQAALLDLGGTGKLNVVRKEVGTQGFYERTDDGGWTEFRRFASWPTIDMQNQNLRYLDLTGNGLADIIVSETDHFLWYPALGTEGYGESIKTVTAALEDDGPRLLFSDGLESIYLADFSGDGLVDLVRIRNGDVCYWPNLGYGRFGAKIPMDNAPWMDSRDRYNRGRVQLADIDGSGVADILYFPSAGGLKVYFNQSGNDWSEPVELAFPLLDSLSQVEVLDLFGLGLSSIVWSTTLPGSCRSSLQYLDFTRGRKPHLLTTYKNGPIEKRMQYTSSTTYQQLDDSLDRRWPTKLSFPVQCLSQVSTYDFLSKVSSQSSYSYHYGYYDGVEREFRGFGKVELQTSEHFLLDRSPKSEFPSFDFVTGLSSPATRTVSWYHTGCYESAAAVTKLYASEFYADSGLGNLALSLRRPGLHSTLEDTNVRQAYRALKGALLHSETYQLDGSAKEHVPLTISDSVSTVKMLQSARGERPGVFLVVSSESVTCQVEQNDEDPRISHNVTLETDDWGNVTKSATIVYGRRASQRTVDQTEEDWKGQGTTIVTYNEQDYTNAVIDLESHRIPIACEARVYEVKGVAPSTELFTAQELSLATLRGLPRKNYTDYGDALGLRLMSRSQTRFLADDLSTLLPPLVLESMALVGETYTLAMTPDVVRLAFRPPENMSSPLWGTSVLGDKGPSGGGYIDLESDGCWWIPSGRVRMTDEKDMSHGAELSIARKSFFQGKAFIDPFGNRSIVQYDDFQLFPRQVTDALGNSRVATFDYRTLQPCLVTDENDNQTASAFDALGQCVGIAVMGKPSSATGDSLEGCDPYLDDAGIERLVLDAMVSASSALARCTSISFSTFPTYSADEGWQPGFNVSVTKDTPAGSPTAENGVGSRGQLQIVITYFDGSGNVLQSRTLNSINPGPEQWVVSDCAVSNNTGAIVRQYDAFFTASPRFGAAPPGTACSTNFYDTSARLVATVFPNRTWTKDVYGAWSHINYDPGDTVMISHPAEDVHVGKYLAKIDDVSFLEPTWYQTMSTSTDALDRRTAKLCEPYADTPTVCYLDAMGQPTVTILDNADLGKYVSRTYTDRQGRVKKVIDSEGRLVGVSDYDMVGACIHTVSMDTGESWLLNNVVGSPIRTCNSRLILQETAYDALQRPLTVVTRIGEEKAFVSENYMYGESVQDSKKYNLRGKLCRTSDQAQVSTTEAYDHLGNALRGSQQLVKEYKDNINWSDSVALEDEIWTWSTTYDALGRPLRKIRADGSVTINRWNHRGGLVSVGTSGGPHPSASDVVKDISYNARGDRTLVRYGNGSESRFEYDPASFWITSRKTTCGKDVLQHLQYRMDCMGRIVRIEDAAEQDVFFRGSVVRPVQTFEYEASGRLSRATGREHLGQTGGNWASTPSSALIGSRDSSPSDGNAMASYAETYAYSPEGNILSISHSVTDRSVPGWTRTFRYSEPSLVEQGKFSNRLSSTAVGNEVSTYRYEGLSGTMGLITSMTGFPLLRYDLSNRLCASSMQNVVGGSTPEITWYRYDVGNQRTRKVTEKSAAVGEVPVRSKDHFYMSDGIEVFRKLSGNGLTVTLERWSWHTNDDVGRVLLTEAKKDLEAPERGFTAVISSFAVADHIGSTTLELNEHGSVVSKEEFSPYGSTTYDATSNLGVDKRYRFGTKERDTETGMYYFENRYLLPWLGRWLSPDPIGTHDGLNVYCYVGGDPINHVDPTGLMFRATKITRGGGVFSRPEKYGKLGATFKAVSYGGRDSVQTIKHNSSFPYGYYEDSQIMGKYESSREARFAVPMMEMASNPVFYKSMYESPTNAKGKLVFKGQNYAAGKIYDINGPGLPVVVPAWSGPLGHSEQGILGEGVKLFGGTKVGLGSLFSGNIPCLPDEYGTSPAHGCTGSMGMGMGDPDRTVFEGAAGAEVVLMYLQQGRKGRAEGEQAFNSMMVHWHPFVRIASLFAGFSEAALKEAGRTFGHPDLHEIIKLGLDASNLENVQLGWKMWQARFPAEAPDTPLKK